MGTPLLAKLSAPVIGLVLSALDLLFDDAYEVRDHEKGLRSVQIATPDASSVWDGRLQLLRRERFFSWVFAHEVDFEGMREVGTLTRVDVRIAKTLLLTVPRKSAHDLRFVSSTRANASPLEFRQFGSDPRW